MIQPLTTRMRNVASPGRWDGVPIAPDVPQPVAHRRPRHGITDLAAAILQDAVDTCHRRDQVGHEAREWLRADDDGWPFSFLGCCAVLGLDADATRSRLLAAAPDWTPPAKTGPAQEQRWPMIGTGCRLCGWAAVGDGVCTDPARHNPCCVARNPEGTVPAARVTAKNGRLLAPCLRCGATDGVKPTRVSRANKTYSVRLCELCAGRERELARDRAVAARERAAARVSAYWRERREQQMAAGLRPCSRCGRMHDGDRMNCSRCRLRERARSARRRQVRR